MAFEDNTGPDLDLFADQGWSDWQDAVESEDGEPASGNETPSSRHNKEVARLKRQDFGLFGYCPAKDNFYVVVCEHCHLPFKPQAFHYHIEKHHKGKTRIKATPIRSEEASQFKSSPFSSQSYTSDRSSVGKSPTPSECSSSTSNGSLGHVTTKRPDKVLLSHAIKHALDKVGSPPGSKSAAQLYIQPIDRGPGVSNFKRENNPAKQSAQSSFALPGGGNSSGGPVGSILASASNAPHRTNKPILKHDSHSKKPHKHSIPMPNKPHKARPENFKKESDRQQHKHDTHAYHSPNKIVKRNNAMLGHSQSYDHPLHRSDKHEQQIITNGPVVVLEKSPLLEKAPSIPHFKNEGAAKMAGFASSSKSAPPSSSSHRQYKHHHNPQLDIVKTPDRGEEQPATEKSNEMLPGKPITKPKKNIPLKSREYDPNKHCGVWVSADNMQCTRSLTCKTHKRSIKRRVPGRRKQFDELVRDQARAKQRLKEKSMMMTPPPTPQQATISATKQGLSDNMSRMSSPPTPVQRRSDVVTSPTMVGKSPNPANSTKSHSQSTSGGNSKSKSSIHLFPRTTPPRHIDCWQESSFEAESEANINNEQTYVAKHPVPLVICRYGCRMMEHRHACYDRRKDYQWRNVLSLLKESSIKKTQKPGFVNPDFTVHTSFNFTPIPSVSSSVLSGLKAAKDQAQLRQENEHFANEPDSDSGYSNNNKLPNSYASSILANAAMPRTQFYGRKPLTKSMSVDSDALLKRNGKQSKMQRSERYTVDSMSGPPLPKSPRCSMPLDHRLTGEIPPTVTHSTHGKFVQLSAPSNFATSSNTTTIDLNSYLTHGNDAILLANDPSISTASSLSNQPVSLQGRSLKGKKGGKTRKNSAISNSGKHNTKYNNHIMPNHIVDEVALSKERMQSASGVRMGDTKSNILSNSESPTTANNQDSTKQEPPLMNGLNSKSFSSHGWPHSVTLSGTIGALMQTNQNANDGSATCVNTVDLDQLNFPVAGAVSFSKQISQTNSNNSNNFEVKHNDHEAFLAAPADVNSTMPNPISLHSLLTGSDTSATRGQLLAEAAARTGLVDVSVPQPASESAAGASSIPENTEHICGLDYITTELLSLLGPGGGGKDATAAPTASADLSAFALREGPLTFTNDSANIAELSNT